MTNSDFRGCYTAIVTPFTADGSAIDWDAFEALVEAQIAARIDGIVFVGTTGESPTLTHEEHDAVIRWSMQTVRGRCKVIVGTGSNSTAEALHFAQMAQAPTTTNRRRKGCTSILPASPTRRRCPSSCTISRDAVG